MVFSATVARIVAIGPERLHRDIHRAHVEKKTGTNMRIRGDAFAVVPMEHSQALIDRLDRSETTFASTTQDVMGQTTEGGEQTTYTQAGVRQVVEQRFYKETGRSTARIYYASGKPFALIVQNIKYAVPLSVDNNGTVQSTEERAYFLDDTGAVCTWQLNGTSQPVDESTVKSVETYLADVL